MNDDLPEGTVGLDGKANKSARKRKRREDNERLAKESSYWKGSVRSAESTGPRRPVDRNARDIVKKLK